MKKGAKATKKVRCVRKQGVFGHIAAKIENQAHAYFVICDKVVFATFYF